MQHTINQGKHKISPTLKLPYVEVYSLNTTNQTSNSVEVPDGDFTDQRI